MSNYSLNPINISSEEFLSAFSGAKLAVEQEHFVKLANLLKEHNDAARGIYSSSS